MQKISINKLRKQEHNKIQLNDYTLEELSNTVNKYGSVTVPGAVLTVIADVRDSKSDYGVLASVKHIYSSLEDVWAIITARAFPMVEQCIRANNILFTQIFNGLEVKSFTEYCKVIDSQLGADKDNLVERVSKALDVDYKSAEWFVGIRLYPYTFNGFIMEYMISEMLAQHPSIEVLHEGVTINDKWISPLELDTKWGIDMLIAPKGQRDIITPIQIKSKTHLYKSREPLQHTFKAHADYKRMYKGIQDKETKGNVYYLHYCMSTLSITIPQWDFEHTLPQSRELSNRVYRADKLDLRYVPIWEVAYLLEELISDIRKHTAEVGADMEQLEVFQFVG